MILDDHEPQNKGFYWLLFLRFWAVTRTLRVNCAEIARVKQPAYEIISIKRRFQQFKSRIPLQGNLRTRASKTGTP